jgi:hypothetical protein
MLRTRRRVPHQLNVTVVVAADDCHRTCLLGIGQHRVACRLKASPVKGAPKLVGTPAMVGRPVWVVAQAGVLRDVGTGGGGLGSVIAGSAVSIIPETDGFGLSATDGGLRPAPPSSVEPSGIPTVPTDPGPMDEAIGEDAGATHIAGALAAVPPPSNSPGAALPMPADAGVVEAPAHAAPIKGDRPDGLGLRPGVASSVAPRGTPVCPTGALGIPSGDVMPSAGSGETFMPTCAWAEPQPKTTAAVTTAKRVNMGLAFHLAFVLSRGRRCLQGRIAA